MRSNTKKECCNAVHNCKTEPGKLNTGAAHQGRAGDHTGEKEDAEAEKRQELKRDRVFQQNHTKQNTIREEIHKLNKT